MTAALLFAVAALPVVGSGIGSLALVHRIGVRSSRTTSDPTCVPVHHRVPPGWSVMSHELTPAHLAVLSRDVDPVVWSVVGEFLGALLDGDPTGGRSTRPDVRLDVRPDPVLDAVLDTPPEVADVVPVLETPEQVEAYWRARTPHNQALERAGRGVRFEGGVFSAGELVSRVTAAGDDVAPAVRRGDR